MFLARTLLLSLTIYATAICYSEAFEPIAVITNKQNSVNSVTNAFMRKAYNNNILRWNDGTPIVLFDLRINDPIRENFSGVILGLSARRIAERWAHLKITNQAKNPPQNMKSQRLVIKRVSRTKGALGYVSLNKFDEQKHSDVKIIAIIQ